MGLKSIGREARQILPAAIKERRETREMSMADSVILSWLCHAVHECAQPGGGHKKIDCVNEEVLNMKGERVVEMCKGGGWKIRDCVLLRFRIEPSFLCNAWSAEQQTRGMWGN